MTIKTELLKSYISDFINTRIENFVIDPSQIADSIATEMLSQIQIIIKNENFSDFEAIEEIIGIFEKYNVDFSTRHDF